MKMHKLSIALAATFMVAQTPAVAQIASPSRAKIRVPPPTPQPAPRSDRANPAGDDVIQYKRGNIKSGVLQQYYCTVETRVDDGSPTGTSTFTISKADDGTLRVDGSGPLFASKDLDRTQKYIFREMGDSRALETAGPIIEPTEEQKRAQDYVAMMKSTGGSSTGYNINRNTGEFSARVIRSGRTSFGMKTATTYTHEGSCTGGV